MFDIPTISILVSIVALIVSLFFYLKFKAYSEDVYREMDHEDVIMRGERIKGTDYKYCNGGCKKVPRSNSKVKCGPNPTCSGGDCSCQLFRRPRPIPKNWDGKYEHVADGDTESDVESGFSYMCWCVEKV